MHNYEEHTCANLDSWGQWRRCKACVRDHAIDLVEEDCFDDVEEAMAAILGES